MRSVWNVDVTKGVPFLIVCSQFSACGTYVYSNQTQSELPDWQTVAECQPEVNW